MARKPLSSRLGKGVCYALIIAFFLPMLLSTTAPHVAASPDKNWETPSAATASSERETYLIDNLENGWTYGEVDTNDKLTDAGNDNINYSEGAASRKIGLGVGGTTATGDYAEITKSIDLTDINLLKIDVRFGYASGNILAKIFVGENEIYTKTLSNIGATDTWYTLTSSAINYIGSQTVKLRFYYSTGEYTNKYGWWDNLQREYQAPSVTIDDITTTKWRPDPKNESGAWARWDLGVANGVRGARIYWGANENYRPTTYLIQISENTTDWTTVVTETEAAPASAWKEYSWTQTSARYVKLTVDTHGSSGTEIYEMDAEVNYSPTIESITVDDSLIDRKSDYFASGAELDTTVTIRVQDNDGYEEISAVYISIRDNNDSVLVDNVQVTDNTVVNENTLDFTYVYNPADNLPDDNLGAFDVDVFVEDIWGENDTNSWGGDGAALFVVDDMQTTIGFDPASPFFGQDLTTSGTVSRVSGSASADNVWLIDEAHGTFSLESGNSWSETFAITEADPAENVSVTVRIKDLPLDGAENSSYVVNSDMRYQIEVRQENDYELVPGVPMENRPLVIEFKWEGGTQENTLTSNPENFVVSTGGEIPFIVTLTDNDEYWRRRVPGSGTGTLVFVLPEENATINQYTMSITDYTDSFDTPDGWVSIRAYIDNTLAVINDDWWDATNHSFAYLVLHRYYDGVYLFNRTGAQRNIGHLQAESDFTLDPFEISALEFGEDKVFRWEAIEFESERGDDGEVVVMFRDVHDNTDSVNVEIYTLTDEWRYQAEFAYPSEFESSWTGADNDNSYKIKLEIVNREFGSWDEWMTVGPIIAPLPLPTPEAGGGLGATIPIAGLAGVFLVAIVAMSFSERHASTGTLAIAFTAIFLKFISVKVGANLMPVPSSVLVLLLFLAIMWKAGEKL